MRRQVSPRSCMCSSCVDDGRPPRVHWPRWARHAARIGGAVSHDARADLFLESPVESVQLRGERLQDALLGLCEQAWELDGDIADVEGLQMALDDLWLV